MVKYTAAERRARRHHRHEPLEPRSRARTSTVSASPTSRIQQITTNILEDMGAIPRRRPPTSRSTRRHAPSGRADRRVGDDAPGTDCVQVTWTPVAGATGYNVYRALARAQRRPAARRPGERLAHHRDDLHRHRAQLARRPTTTSSRPSRAACSRSRRTRQAATTAAAAGQPTRINAGGARLHDALRRGLPCRRALHRRLARFSAAQPCDRGTSDPTLYQDERWGQFTLRDSR